MCERLGEQGPCDKPKKLTSDRANYHHGGYFGGGGAVMGGWVSPSIVACWVYVLSVFEIEWVGQKRQTCRDCPQNKQSFPKHTPNFALGQRGQVSAHAKRRLCKLL